MLLLGMQLTDNAIIVWSCLRAFKEILTFVNTRPAQMIFITTSGVDHTSHCGPRAAESTTRL